MRAILLFVLLLAANAVCAVGKNHVILVVWDGMRPDFVDEQHTPTLQALAQSGVRFLHHHSTYLTATDVNGTALATGMYPEHSNVFANYEWLPAINARQPVDTSVPENWRIGDRVMDGKYLAVATLPEMMRAAGHSVALAGSKAVAFLFDRKAEWFTETLQNKPITVLALSPMAAANRDEMAKRIGAAPADDKTPAAERNVYTTRALTDVLWRDGVPEFSLLWLSEPDLSQHGSAPGSPAALAAIKSSDECLARVLAALQEKGVRDSTDVLVVSDHGFSTIQRSVDLVAMLNAAGFHAGREFAADAQAGDVLVAGNGGSILLYVRAHDPAVTTKLVAWLQHRDFAGVLFTREKFEGTFPLHAAHIAVATEQPDIVLSLHWSDDKNRFGTPGLVNGDWNRAPNFGTHASLSYYDLTNTLVASGPHFKKTFEDDVPTGNIDVAPTVAHIIGVAAKFDGRVLSEALRDGSERNAETRELVATRDFDDGHWQQNLRISTVETTDYLDEGNGALHAKETPASDR
ncbi:MAG: alkaline phosphatase family protein [Verrucomicrobiota bacterium]|nr:alkaline phosphatase family protein [Verrucomicrobiota bacterium]